MSWKTIVPEKEDNYKLLDKTLIRQQTSLYLIFVYYGPQTLAISVLMVLPESFGHVCDLRYLKLTTLVFFGSPRFVQNCHFGLL